MTPVPLRCKLNDLKYIVAAVNGQEAIYLFPKTIDHDRMFETMGDLLFVNNSGGVGPYDEGDLISAGFVDDGMCHGRSETLDLASRGELDTRLLPFKKENQQSPVLSYFTLSSNGTAIFFAFNPTIAFEEAVKAAKAVRIGYSRDWTRAHMKATVLNRGSIHEGIMTEDPIEAEAPLPASNGAEVSNTQPLTH